MHILQVNDRLPDARVEKAIRADQRLGHKVSTLIFKVSSPVDVPDLHVIPLSLQTALYRMRKFRPPLRELVDEIDPDVIHAHNIFIARAVTDFGYPVIYNDHEYWSKSELANNPISLPFTRTFIKKRIAWPYRYLTFKRWEKYVLKRSVVVTQHERTASEHRRRALGAFVWPNQPEMSETADVWERAKESERDYEAVFIGADMGMKSCPYRRAEKAYKLLKKKDVKLIIIGDKRIQSSGNVLSTGYIEHKKIYDFTLRSTSGLIAWKSHPHHRYCNTNKFYLYVHSGALPIIPHLMGPSHDEFLLRFKKIKQIPELIEQAKRIDPMDVIEYAKSHYVLEQHDDVLKEAYECLMEQP